MIISNEVISTFLEVETSSSQDQSAHGAMSICGGVINFLNASNQNSSQLQVLWDKTQLWVVERPDFIQSVLELYANDNDLLPTIIFASPAASKFSPLARVQGLGTHKT